MLEFFDALARHNFLQYALVSGLLASVACGVVGTYVVARRISYIAAGIAHSVLGGMGVAHYLNVVHDWAWLQPLHGAVVSGLLAAVVIGLVSLRARQREDTVIGAIWAVGMAVGILFITATPGYQENLMNYLIGNILMVSGGDLWLLAALDAVVLVIGLLFHRQIAAVCFDEEFARVRGLAVEFYFLLLLCLTALTVVLLVSVVGIILVIALLTIPVAVAGKFTRTMWQTMLVATVVSAVFTTLGLAISYAPNWPAGATIILLAGAVYLLVLLPVSRRRRNGPKARPTRTKL
ncbi:iron chelate uptake ABC transporter family permease subunit [candidate division GN15 bacterium]|nr:iron chelate uptake ABC transporter family permease subunit [candidate division GN15 bacterium]